MSHRQADYHADNPVDIPRIVTSTASHVPASIQCHDDNLFYYVKSKFLPGLCVVVALTQADLQGRCLMSGGLAGDQRVTRGKSEEADR